MICGVYIKLYHSTVLKNKVQMKFKSSNLTDLIHKCLLTKRRSRIKRFLPQFCTEPLSGLNIYKIMVFHYTFQISPLISKSLIASDIKA